MKKIVFCLTAACLSLVFLPMQSIAQKQTTPETTSSVVTQPPATVKPIEARTVQQSNKEVTAKDNSKLNSSDKANLQQIEGSNGYHHHGGVYISVGGAILIIFILIVLF